MIPAAALKESDGLQQHVMGRDGLFRLQTGGCMKNCGKGPCVRWDGTVYTGMTPESLRALIEKK